jgi:hypothetical protein
MAEQIMFVCHFCQAKNWVNRGDKPETIGKKPVALVCGDCCLLNNGKNLKKKSGSEDWIECIPYEGAMKDVPSGHIKVLDGISIYIDAKGKEFTREQFIFAHGIDPKCYLRKRDKLEAAFDSGRPAPGWGK